MKKYTQLFGKTRKITKTYDSKNATYLIKAGYVDQVMAGVYIYLPLGKRVLSKIEDIIRKEMDKVSNEIFMSSLSPKELWEKTSRLEKVDVLFKVVGANSASESKNKADYILNPTHEDMVTPLAQKFTFSYKDFPLCVYQIQTKFRNEARPKSGLMRGREFRMKDAYSFHCSEKDLLAFYEVMKQAYVNTFNSLGIGADTVIALASGGDFTDEFSHEFQTLCETGEDILFKDVDTGIIYNREVTPSQAPKLDDSEELLPLEEVEGEGIVGVEELAKFLNIPVEKTTKTIIFKTDEDELVAAAVRGSYEIDEEKLKRVLGCKQLHFADEKTLKEITGAEPGYAGILNLPANVRLIIDESVVGRKNFECGANKTNHHTINVNFGRDIPEPEKVYDIKVARPGDCSPTTGKPYEVMTGSEVGNIFPLNTKFSEAFDFKYTDVDGKQKLVYMGCYGIGPSRVMGVIAEKYSDEKGLVWPKPVTPFAVHFITLGNDNTEVAEKTISAIEANGFDVLWDDREKAGAGEKLADADLIGIPLRILLSKRSKEKGGVEVSDRHTGKTEIVSLEGIVDYVSQYYKQVYS